MQPQDPEPEASAFQQPISLRGISQQDVRKRPTNRSRRTVERSELEGSADAPREGVYRKGGSRGRSGSTSDSDGVDISVLSQSGEGESPVAKPRRRHRKRSESPPHIMSKSAVTTERRDSKSEGGLPMSQPESEQFSDAEPSSLLMRSVEDSSTLLVASTRYMPPTSLGDVTGDNEGQLAPGSSSQQDGSNSSDGSTPTLSPPQCNTPSSISVVGDEASLASSDDMTQDNNRRPALANLQISVSGELEPELLGGADGGTSPPREGSVEDDDDFEVLHKEQIP